MYWFLRQDSQLDSVYQIANNTGVQFVKLGQKFCISETLVNILFFYFILVKKQDDLVWSTLRKEDFKQGIRIQVHIGLYLGLDSGGGGGVEINLRTFVKRISNI